MTSTNGKAIILIIFIVIITIVVLMINRRKCDNRKSSKIRTVRKIGQARIEVGRSRHRKHSDSDSSSCETSLGQINDRCSTRGNQCDTGLTCINGRCACFVPMPVRISTVNSNANSVSISWFPSDNADLYQAFLYQQSGNPPTLIGPESIKSVTGTFVEFDNLTVGNYVVRIFSSSNLCGQSSNFTTVPFTVGGNAVITADKIIANEIIANKIIDGDLLINPNQTEVSVGQYQFDCSEVNPNFPNFKTHSPVKPTFVPDALWNEMLVNLSSEQRRLTENFISGRNALGLPQFEKINPDGITGNFVDLVATKTTILSSFDLERNTWRYEPNVGWDLHCTNTLYRDFLNPETISASGTFSWSGNIGIDEGTLTLDNPSIVLVYGAVLQGLGIPWGTTIYDISQANSGIYGLSMSTESAPAADIDLNFQASRWGPKNVSVFVQVGILSQIDGVPVVIDVDHGNRQFEPTIDYSDNDTSGLTHTGEQWIGTKPIPSDLALDLSLLSSVDVPVVQLAIFAEEGVDVYFTPPACTTIVKGDRRMVKQIQADTGDGNSTANATIVSAGKAMVAIISAESIEDPANPNSIILRYTLADQASVMGDLPRIISVQNSNPLFNGDFSLLDIPITVDGNIVSLQVSKTAALVGGLTSTGGRMYRDQICFSGDALVLMADGVMQKKAMDIQVGDRVASLNGEVLEIIATTLHPKGQGNKRLVDMSNYAPGLIISDYHRVQVGGQWVRPFDLPKVRIFYDDIDLYNFVADRRMAIIVNGLPATTLGMYCEGGTHDFDKYPTQRFWCTDAIVDHLKSRSDWPRIVFTNSQMADMKRV